jgi:ribosomal protein S18 acetylase RimI-like enzyme
MRTDLLTVLERYYDAAPRPMATAEQVGPFTLFVRDGGNWDFYARPRLRLAQPVTRADVDEVRSRQRELGVPESLEWVAATTPSLLGAARESGLVVTECPLLVFAGDTVPAPATGTRVLGPDDPDLGAVVAAIGAGFGEIDDFEPRSPGRRPDLMERGLLTMVGAYDGPAGAAHVVGGGSHAARGATTELTGIAVLPRARRRGVGAAITATLVADARGRGVETVFLSAQDDAVARLYERIGFARVGAACTAEPPTGMAGR